MCRSRVWAPLLTAGSSRSFLPLWTTPQGEPPRGLWGPKPPPVDIDCASWRRQTWDAALSMLRSGAFPAACGAPLRGPLIRLLRISSGARLLPWKANEAKFDEAIILKKSDSVVRVQMDERRQSAVPHEPSVSLASSSVNPGSADDFEDYEYVPLIDVAAIRRYHEAAGANHGFQSSRHSSCQRHSLTIPLHSRHC